MARQHAEAGLRSLRCKVDFDRNGSMIQLVATKYDPSNRDPWGAYTVDEWTSSSDVGRVYNGSIVTPVDYLQIEDAYVACVKQLLAYSHCDGLCISGLEDRRGHWKREEARRGRPFLDPVIARMRPAALGPLQDGLTLGGTDLESLVRMILREQLWCRLAGPGGTQVRFGYDYYMYIMCDSGDLPFGPPPTGMFYEELESPYTEMLLGS